MGITLEDGIEGSGLFFGRVTVFYLDVANDGGYVTDSAWGYRVLASLDYADVVLKPFISFTLEVDGYSPAPAQQLNEAASR